MSLGRVDIDIKAPEGFDISLFEKRLKRWIEKESAFLKGFGSIIYNGVENE